MSGRDPNDDIEKLKEELRRHKIKIADLEQQLQQDRNCSTEKIRKLEEEKTTLENEVRLLKMRIESASADRERQLSEKDAQINTILNQIGEIIKKSQDQENELTKQRKELEEQKSTVKKCHEEIIFFTKKSQDQEKALKIYMAKTDELENHRNKLYIGELCAKEMEAIYLRVLPDYFEQDDYKQPHLKGIDRKIEEVYPNSGDKQEEARARWENLKTAEKIGAELVDFMEEMLAERNKEAHPFPLYEKELKKIASNLPGQKQQSLEKLIQIAKRHSVLI